MKTKNKRGPGSSLLCLLCLVAAELSASAAPPAATYLYPAGAQVGTTVEVVAAGTLDPWPPRVWVSGKGVSVVPGKEKGKFSVAVAKDAMPGVYWLRAINDDGVSSPRPFIVGTLPEATEKEPNDEFRKPQPINGNVVVNGRLEKSGDVDCFAVQLKQGQTLVASVEANHILRSPIDAILQVTSPDGFVLDENHDTHGLDPQLAFTASKDGTYVVRVFAFPSMPDSSIRFFGSDACVYRLTLTTAGFARHAMPLAVNDPVKALGVDVEGWNIPKRLSLVHTLPEPHEAHINVQAPGVEGTMRVRLEPHHTFGPQVPEKCVPPFSVSARIEKLQGEVRVPIVAKKGQPLTLQVESHEYGLALNPLIRVFDAEKKQVARAEPTKLHSDTTLTFNPPADGVYTAVVSDLYDGAGLRFAFLLRVLVPTPDYELSTATDRFTLTPGQPTTIPVKVTRRGGFTKPVDVIAEGLPEGVKFEITQPAKPDPNTVTITLTSEKPIAASFRLLGRVKDDPKLTRVARAPLPEFDVNTVDLWLTPGIAPTPKKKK